MRAATEKSKKGKVDINKMNTVMQNGASNASVIELCRGRTAFAYASVSGETNSIEGTASFYYTPLGMLVHSCVCGLEAEDGVYSLEIRTKSGGTVTLPPLYARNGNAWGTALTAKTSILDVLGGRLVIRQKNKTLADCGIRPPMIMDTSIPKAE